jgi:hypothetical protein
MAAPEAISMQEVAMRRLDDPGWGYVRAGLIGAVVAAVVLLALPVTAAVGDALKLGKGNAADAVTSLSGAAAANLRLTNTQADKPALDLRVAAGAPPLKVNSGAMVQWLNADRLDGRDGTNFAPAGHDHGSTYLGIDAKAADADKLDGKHLYQVRPLAAGCSTTNAPDAASWECLVNISPATSGTITFSGSLGILFNSDEVSALCSFWLDGVVQAPSVRLLDMATGEWGQCASEGYSTGVTAGPHTIVFKVDTFVSTHLDAGSVEVMFFPTG